MMKLLSGLSILALLVAPAAAQTAKSADARLKHFEDKEEIEQLLLDYGRHLDARDFAAYAGLFSADGEWSGGFGSVKGPANIKVFMEKAMPGANTAHSYHLMSNFVIAVNGDAATAWSRWAFVVPGAHGATIEQAGRYDDRLVREHGRWRFKQRAASNDTTPPPPAPAAK